MTLQQQLNFIENELVARLSAITDTSRILPHTVYVEEEGENEKGEGISVYNRYSLTAINSDGSCTLLNPTTQESETDRHLSEINIDWLVTLWDWHKEQQDEPVIENYPEFNLLEKPLRLLLDVAVHEIPCFEQSHTYDICAKAIDDLEKANIEPPKELFAFLYPVERFDRNATDEEIVTDYNNIDSPEPEVEKLTPDEFAEKINDEFFNDQGNWVRFIKM